MTVAVMESPAPSERLSHPARNRTSRDPVLDAMRGVFILSMTAGHLAGGEALDRWTHPLVWVDGAAGFVLFSGLVLGMQQRRLLSREGWQSGQRWLVRRAAVIYAIHVALTLLALSVRSLTGRPPWLPSIGSLGGPAQTLLGVLTLQVQPDYANVLPLYVALLVAALGIMWLLRTGRTMLCVGISAVLYAASQYNPQLIFVARRSVGSGTWVWGSWQLLFVVGMVVGWHWTAVRAFISRYRVPVVALSVLATLTLATVANLLMSGFWAGAWEAGWPEDLFEKYTLRPGVPLYLAAAVVATYAIFTRLRHVRGGGALIGVLGRMGSRSLDCFIMLSVVQLAVFTVHPDPRPALVDALLVALTAVAFWLLATWRRGQVRSSIGGAARTAAPVRGSAGLAATGSRSTANWPAGALRASAQ